MILVAVLLMHHLAAVDPNRQVHRLAHTRDSGTMTEIIQFVPLLPENLGKTCYKRVVFILAIIIKKFFSIICWFLLDIKM